MQARKVDTSIADVGLIQLGNEGGGSLAADCGSGSSGNGDPHGNNGQPQDADHARLAAAGSLRIEAEPTDRINVGAGGKLIVPREDIGEGIEAEEDLSSAEHQRLKVRKPGRREWIALDPTSELTTRLLIHKPKADGIEVEHYYVIPPLRGPIIDELKMVRVFHCYSFASRTFFLWPINVNLDNSWYDSLLPLLGMKREFFLQNAFRVISDKANQRYRVKFKALSHPVTWIGKATGELLGEALGDDHLISAPDHPIYQDLVGGQELS
jgi:hypothetical protein